MSTVWTKRQKKRKKQGISDNAQIFCNEMWFEPYNEQKVF